MALMTGEQYIESIRRLNMQVYLFGKKIDSPVDDPILRPSLNSVRMTYDLAQLPEYQDLMTARSGLTGERVNRFTHIHQSTEDLVKKVKMQRLLGQQTAACFGDCRVIATGMRHGTVTVLLGGEALEITTYRRDGVYTDNRHRAYRGRLLAYVQTIEQKGGISVRFSSPLLKGAEIALHAE